MIKDLLVAERYAKALFELARPIGRDEEVEAELESFSAALKADPGLERLFGNPYLKTEEKRAFVEKMYSKTAADVQRLLVDFFSVLFEKHRFGLVHEIAVQFKRIADEAQGQATAQIVSAAPLSAAHESAIVSRLEAMAGYKIQAEKKVDPSLIGGVVVHIKNKIIDGSVKSRIESMKEEFSKVRGI